MRSLIFACFFAVSPLIIDRAFAEDVKIGVIGTFSGPYAVFGKNFKMGVEAWVAEHGNKIGQDTVTFVYRDEEGPDPAKARALAQELIVKDHVEYLAGVYFTPDAMAILPLLVPTDTPLIVWNAATSSITQKSPLVVRTSFTMWQNAVPAAEAAAASGSKKVAILVSDYGPGLDAEAAFRKTFEAKGGSVVAAIRIPLATRDFAPIMQKVTDAGADTIFVFLPSGPPVLAFIKAYDGAGLRKAGVKILSTGDIVTEPDLPAIGDAALGAMTTYHYAASHESAENKAFLAQIAKDGDDPHEVTMAAVAAYDGAHVLYDMIAATGGKRDGRKAVAAVLGRSWISPRGPVQINAKSRHITQNVYLREVVRVDGRLENKEIKTFAAQPDWGSPP